jgi:cupin 2 domain-containing protein
MSTDDRHRPPVETGNLFAGVAARLDAERFDTLVETEGLRLERIVSTGQTTPAGEWFDQDRDEWVVLVAGTAELLFEGEAAPRPLAAGDWLRIPAHARHRVTRTDPDRPTVWLALHHAPDPPPGRPPDRPLDRK